MRYGRWQSHFTEFMVHVTRRKLRGLALFGDLRVSSRVWSLFVKAPGAFVVWSRGALAAQNQVSVCKELMVNSVFYETSLAWIETKFW